MIQYDEDMFSQLFSSENRVKRYKHLIAGLRDDKAKDDQTLLNMEEEITSTRLDLKEARNVSDNLRKVNSEMLQRIDELQRQNREATQSIPPSLTGPPVAAHSNYRPRGINPAEPLTGKSPETYNSWAYSVRQKLDTDSPLYTNDQERARYALSQMKDPIFDAMYAWVEDVGDALTMKGFFEEVENYFGLEHQQKDAKKELLTSR
jgi:hypothetical protein